MDISGYFFLSPSILVIAHARTATRGTTVTSADPTRAASTAPATESPGPANARRVSRDSNAICPYQTSRSAGGSYQVRSSWPNFLIFKSRNPSIGVSELLEICRLVAFETLLKLCNVRSVYSCPCKKIFILKLCKTRVSHLFPLHLYSRNWCSTNHWRGAGQIPPWEENSMESNKKAGLKRFNRKIYAVCCRLCFLYFLGHV